MSGTHIALLRGINVGTAKRVAMADLRKLVEGLGFTDVRTLLNSGNVVFTAKGRADGKSAAGGASRSGATAEIAARIEQAVVAKTGVSAKVTVLTAAEVAEAVAGNPLLKQASDPSRLLVYCFARPADMKRLAPLVAQSWKPDALALGKRVAYAWCVAGVLDSKLSKAAAKALGDTVTARNWATVLKLQALLEDAA